MKKLLCILFLFLIGVKLKAQISDSIHHYFGVGAGLISAKYPLDLNLNYIYFKKKFIFKCEGGIMPITNYSPSFRLFPTFGFAGTQAHEKPHIGFGIGGVFGFNGRTEFHGVSPIINGGLILPSNGSRKILYGLDLSAGVFKRDHFYTSSGGINGFETFYHRPLAFLDFIIYF